MWAAYRQAKGISVPCPMDKETPEAPWWFDHIASKAQELRDAGITAVLLPPLAKTQGGSSPHADGYAPYDDYDLGSKNQMGSVSTRFGSFPKLMNCCRALTAAGLDIYADWVPHQRLGGIDGHYDTPPFVKTPGCFTGYDAEGNLLPGRVPRDPIAGPVEYDSGVYGFGDELCPINSDPPGYVMDGLLANARWLQGMLGIKGFRDDDAKGQAIEAVRRFVETVNVIVIVEYVDGPQTLNWYCWEALGGRVMAFDFPFQGTVRDMCNNAGNFDMRRWTDSQVCLASISPPAAMTFVDSPDTDVNVTQAVISNKLFAYAMQLTYHGYPSIYWRDYAEEPGCYGLKRWIDNLMYIHENYSIGPLIFRYAEFQVLVYERQGRMLAAFNNDPFNGWATVTVQTDFWPHTRLHDVTGNNAQDCQTDENSAVTFGVPPNVNGHGYGCWVVAQ